MEPGQEELPLPPAPAPWRGRKPKQWWVRRQAALAAHRAKKAKKQKAQRQADLDVLTHAANENQGFALLPAEGPTKEELKAELYLQFQEDVRRQLEEAKAAREAHWEKQLKGQSKLTSFFKPSTGCLPGLRAAVGNPLAAFRGARGALAPACAQPEQLPPLTATQRERDLKRREDLLAK